MRGTGERVSNVPSDDLQTIPGGRGSRVGCIRDDLKKNPSPSRGFVFERVDHGARDVTSRWLHEN